jgi:quercetin dioxygenase-like cupin family protein
MALSMLDKPGRRTDAPWPRAIKEDFERNQFNGQVGTKLLSESDRVRVWEIRLEPGERINFHRHVLDYFWTAVTAGRARSHYGGGSTIETSYDAGETRHETYALGESKVHDLENIGDAELVFTTVEFLDGANAPLPLPDEVRRRAS